MKRFAFGLVLAAMVGVGGVNAQTTQSDAPIYVRSNTGGMSLKECKGAWEGDVVATRGEARLMSDKLTPQGSREGDDECETERLIAEANVIYTTPKVKIRGDRAEYDQVLEIITFTGDVILNSSDGSLMRGTSLIYSLADEHARISADDERVEMIIPSSKRRKEVAAN